MQAAEEPIPPEEDVGWLLPAGVEIHEDADLDADDPALGEDGRRQCIAASRAGTRCRATPAREHVLCNAHAGKLDSSAGGHARAQKLRLVAETAQNRVITARMGTRATIAAALAEKHEQIRLAVHGLADRAADGDRQAALALLPFLTQALGTPSPSMPTLVGEGADAVDLSALDTASLKALLTPEPSP